MGRINRFPLTGQHPGKLEGIAVGAHHTTVPCRSAGRHLAVPGLAGFGAMACERYSRLSGDLSLQTDAVVTVGPASHTNRMHISGMGNLSSGVSRRYVILTICLSATVRIFQHPQYHAFTHIRSVKHSKNLFASTARTSFCGSRIAKSRTES